MAKVKDIRGRKFGRLTAIERVSNRGAKVFYLFRCDCGNEKEISKNRVEAGNSTSCGCLRKQNEADFVGNRYNYLTAIKRIGYHTSDKVLLWLFRCVCGKEKEINFHQVQSGKLQSCGCMLRKTMSKKKSQNISAGKYNSLTAIKFVRREANKTMWLFRCDCGKEKEINKSSVVSGFVKTCGCYDNGGINPRYKGSYFYRGGYVMVSQPYKNGKKQSAIAEHRLIMEEHIGRKLFKFETVHHKNGIRDDNRIENLELWSSPQPYGQRAKDLIGFAREVLELYNDLFPE